MEENAIQRTIDAYFGAFANRDAEAFVACFAEDGALEQPVGRPQYRGHSAIRAFVTPVMARFASLEMVPDLTVINTSSAAISWRGRGVPRDGQPFAVFGVEVMDFTAEGKIALCRAFTSG